MYGPVGTNSTTEPNGVPVSHSKGKTYFVCTQEVPGSGGHPQTCGNKVADGVCEHTHLPRPTSFAERVATGVHGNSIGPLVRRGN